MQRVIKTSEPAVQWDYALAAEEVLVEPGVVVTDKVSLQAIHIHEVSSGDLVTIVELISPGSKDNATKMAVYQRYREDFIDKGVNILEIDLTRSNKRLMSNNLVQEYPYHAGIYLPGYSPRVVGMLFDQALKRAALPLRGQVVPVSLQEAYEHGYRNSGIADQLLAENQYRIEKLSESRNLSMALKNYPLSLNPFPHFMEKETSYTVVTPSPCTGEGAGGED